MLGLRRAWQRRSVDRFHRIYYGQSHRTWQNTFWMGVPVAKCPLDLHIYQEILFETRPDVIVEAGTFRGGSALYLAQLCDLLGAGHVYSVDIDAHADAPRHSRITYQAGSSVDPAWLERLREEVAGRRTMVVLDSNHEAAHVGRELSAYAPLVSPGCYLIVEDTNVNGHPVFREHGPGPMEAVSHFLNTPQGKEFENDPRREKFMLTFNPGGYLRRKT